MTKKNSFVILLGGIILFILISVAILLMGTGCAKKETATPASSGEGTLTIAETQIGSAGGSVAIEDVIKLQVPAGALEKEVAITITAGVPDTGATLRTPVSRVVRFEPAAVEFSTPVQVTFFVDLVRLPQTVPVRLLRVWQTDSSGNWQPLPTTSSGDAFSAAVTHFSDGAIGYDVNTCPLPSVECNGVCVNLGNSTVNCGRCGNICGAGKTCAGGQCSSCPAGTAECGTGTPASCIDIQNSYDNCGRCGHRCMGSQMCTGGKCAEESCKNPSEQRCFGICVNMQTSTVNCGVCGHICGANRNCAGGYCADCRPGLTECGEGCFDLSKDSVNCGRCGNICGANRECIAGSCTDCKDGMVQCGGSCFDLLSNVYNCGGCGHVCGVGRNCVNGSCTECPEGQDLCPKGGGCYDLQSDMLNCGRCGRSCGANTHCEEGDCVCASRDLTRCGDGCYDLDTDYQNCGSCGHYCPLDYKCMGGDCGLFGACCTDMTCAVTAKQDCSGVFLGTDTACGYSTCENICGNNRVERNEVCDNGARNVPKNSTPTCEQKTETGYCRACLETVPPAVSCGDGCINKPTEECEQNKDCAEEFKCCPESCKCFPL